MGGPRGGLLLPATIDESEQGDYVLVCGYGRVGQAVCELLTKKLVRYKAFDMDPYRVAEARDWYRLYKTAEGKGENEYGMGGRAIDGAEALRVAVGTHDLLRDWVDGKAKCDFDGEACWK